LKRRQGLAWAAVILLAPLAWGQTDPGGAYRGPVLGHTGDIPYPMNSSTTGIVTLDISVDSTGAVQNVGIVRDVPPLTSAAQSAVASWQVIPGMVNGLAAPGILRVNVVFNPFNPNGVGLPSPPLQPAKTNDGPNKADFQPAQVTEAHYATYPPHTVKAGTVVLQVHVESGGQVQGVIVARGTGSLSGTASKAVKNWKFVPASYRGKAVASDVVVTYVFASPAAGTR